MPAALHPDVEDQQRGLARADGRQRRFGVAGGADRIALVLQDAGDQLADVGLVVDDQNVAGHAHASFKLSRGLRAVRRGRRARRRKRAATTRAPGAWRGVGQDQLAAVVFHDPLDDGQAQAGALLAGGHIGLGQAVAVLGRQADAVVLDLEVDATVGVDDQRARDPARRLGVARARRAAIASPAFFSTLVSAWPTMRAVAHQR